MVPELVFGSIFLGGSVLLNIVLSFYAISLSKKPQIQPKEVKTVDAVAILRDLTAYGSSLVKIERIDPSDFFLRGTK